MKRSKLAATLIVLGVCLIAFAPIWRFGVGPRLIKLPADLSVTSKYRGTLEIYADRSTMKLLPEGDRVLVPLSIHAEDVADPGRSDAGTLVIEERVTVRNSDTGEELPGVRPDTTYAIDRRTCENVPGHVDGVDRYGYTIKFPMLSEKKSYGFFDDDLGDLVTSRFVRETKMDGHSHKGVRIYIYAASTPLRKMKTAPPGLPEKMTGRQLKEMGLDVPVSDASEIRLEYFKKVDLVQRVEPKTGMVVYPEKNGFEYYVKNAPGAKPEHLKLAAVEYGGTVESSKNDIDSMSRYARLIDLDLRVAPLSCLAGGVLLAGIGVGIGVRRRGRRRTET